MKNFRNYLLLGLTVLFVACSNEENLTSESESSSAILSLDLQSLKYSDLAGVLSNVSFSDQAITLHDGVDSWTIHLKQDKMINIEERGHKVLAFAGQSKDSIEAILSPNYAALRLHRHGERIGYVTYRDGEEMAKVANHYKTQYLPTRSIVIDDIITLQGNADTRSEGADIKCIRLNMTKAIESNPFKGSYDNTCVDVKSKRMNTPVPLLMARDVQRTLSIVLLKEQNGNCIDHEIVWQITDAKTSIEFLVNSGLIVPGFILMDSKHEGNNSYYAESALKSFQSFLRNADAAAGHGEKTYILMRDGIWGDDLGFASEIGIIHFINPYSNFEIAAVSTSSSLYPYTLAHELGHLLGAEHTSNEEDLMYPAQNDNQKPVHSADNMDKILTSLQLGM
ncbi:fragilysin family metalloproteinase [Bacteroides uniformis]|uniref:fragilysin family metalloproteinase n=1 Tax=Bacteroides uniformis TaxID=820 RepID=UPI00233F18F8|nr:fragilysin family metalloproteinase [Bacteroides uniformis]MDC1809042.1 fragilysin family metalloproteinase [Bacteroides uniformis]